MLRALVRACEPAQLLEHARHAADRMVDDITSVARDDTGSGKRREKAAEFLLHLRSQRCAPRGLPELVDRVAEAAAATRYRSGTVMDFLAVWLFVAGEQFITTLEDPAAAADLEAHHVTLWNRFRANLLETLEAGAERLREGRRFRLAEMYLARFRIARARHEERLRSQDTLLAAERNDVLGSGGPDYVAAMVVDLFALSLSERQQTLIVAQVPGPHGHRPRGGFAAHDHRRLWAPLRSVRPEQAFEKWSKLRQELGMSARHAVQEYSSGMTTHLRRTWEWFFPDRHPFGMLRAALHQLETATRHESDESHEDELVDALFRRYSETLSFIVRLATEESVSPGSALDLDDDAIGAGGA